MMLVVVSSKAGGMCTSREMVDMTAPVAHLICKQLLLLSAQLMTTLPITRRKHTVWSAHVNAFGI